MAQEHQLQSEMNAARAEFNKLVEFHNEVQPRFFYFWAQISLQGC